MGILLAFAVLDRLVGPAEGLIAGAPVAAILLLRERLWLGRSPKLLEVGTFLLFGGLALYTVVNVAAWSIVGVRLWVDAGLLIIVLASIAIRRPFTLQYARERAPSDLWNSPAFVRVNSVITAGWALASAAMVVADLIRLYRPDLPPRIGTIMTVLALIGAVKFTSWHPERKAAS